MTQVILHGILAKEFRKSFSLAIKRPKEVFDAISCSHSNFRNRIAELANQGIHFALLVDGKKITELQELNIQKESQEIHLVPLIIGSGGGMIVAAIIGGGATAGTLVGGAAFAASVINAVIIGVVSLGIQMALAPKPKMDRPESVVNSAKQSFLFSSKANTSEQGIPVPIGYGRLRVGSAMIQSTIKSYPQGFEKSIALKTNGQSINNDR